MPPVVSLALVPRLLQTPAARALAMLRARLPAPVQRLARRSVQRLGPLLPALQVVLGALQSRGRRALRWRATGSADARVVAIDIREKADLLERLRTGTDYRVRSRAAKALAGCAGEEVAVALVAALEDRSAEVAFEAAQALRHHASPTTAAALKNVVQNSSGFYCPLTRSAAVSALGAVLPEDQDGPIVSAVSDADAEVSIAAIGALIDRGPQKNVGVLLSLLESNEGYYLPLTRQVAAEGLPALGEDLKARVRALLETENDDRVRDALSSRLAAG